jgi:transmembrane sensor
MQPNSDSIGRRPPQRVERWWDDAETDPVHVAAVEWLTVLQQPEISAHEISEWLEWMHRDLKHAVAFERLEAISTSLRGLEFSPARDARTFAQERYDGSVPLSKWHRQAVRRRVAIAASVVLGTMFCGALLRSSVDEHESAAVVKLSTVVGENRSVALEDGSRVTMGGRTSVEVAFSDDDRSVQLKYGEAYFQVAKDPSRMFTVHVGGVSATAVGTAFNVHRDPESQSAAVTVTEGRVSVGTLQRSGSERPSAVHLNAGEQVTVDSSGIGPVIRIADLASVTSWQSGRLSFRQRPLRDVVNDLNRYVSKPIVLATPEIGSLVVTGTIATTNVNGWIASLQRAFQLTAVTEEKQITVYSTPVKRDGLAK